MLGWQKLHNFFILPAYYKQNIVFIIMNSENSAGALYQYEMLCV